MSLPAPAPVKPESPTPTSNGHPPAGGNGHMGGSGNGNGHGGSGGGPGGPGDRGTGWPGEAPPPGGSERRTPRRRSAWPFLLDLGLALALFDLIILRQGLVVVGAVLAVVALAGWIREARSDYSRLKD